MKKAFNTVLNFGVGDWQSSHDNRRIKAANLLNLVIIFFLLVGFSNFFILGSEYAFGPVLLFLSLSILSLYFSKLRKNQLAFSLFTINANLSIFFINEYYPIEVGAYLYYFPILVSVVLLVNPSFKDKFSVLHFSICVLFIVANFVVDVPSWRVKNLSPQTAHILWLYDLIISLSITGLIGFMLTRLILKQNNEIITQNRDLIKTKVEIDNSLKEKEVLLAELHHRVKNNLAIISGLLNLQETTVQNPEALQIIGDTRQRLMSIAMVHKMLYQNTELKNIDIGHYSSALISELFKSSQLDNTVAITEKYDRIILPVDKSIPLGLVLNEIVTNSIKYAFKDNPISREHSFFISIRRKEQQVEVLVQDSGKGFPDGINTSENSASLGIYLIKTLVDQIDGNIHFSNNNGARITLNFSHN